MIELLYILDFQLTHSRKVS